MAAVDLSNQGNHSCNENDVIDIWSSQFSPLEMNALTTLNPLQSHSDLNQKCDRHVRFNIRKIT